MNPSRMPVAFVTDFGPMAAVDSDDYTRALAKLGRDLPRPRGVIVMSGHWEAADGLALTASERPPTIYDYFGFPKRYYDVAYECPGDPKLARQAADLLGTGGVDVRLDGARGLDHGAWVPLSRMYPGTPMCRSCRSRCPPAPTLWRAWRSVTLWAACGSRESC